MPFNKRISITLPAGPNVQDSISSIQWAEKHGFDDAWLADTGAPDALTLCGILAGHTQRIRIGVAVTPVYIRTPAVLAASAYCLSQALPNRFVLGLGSSSETIMKAWHGQKMELPLTRTRDTLLMVRSMLAGEKSDFSLKTLHSKGYRQPPLDNPSPLYVGALRGKMIEMAGEHADGVIFNLWPRPALPKMISHLKAGAERAGRSLDDIEVVNRFMVCVTDDVAAARNRFRAAFAPYYANPVYNKFLAWAGFEQAASTIAEGWQEKDRAKTTSALTDELVDEISISGSAEYCHQRIREATDGGVHTAIIAPNAVSKEELQATYEAFSADRFSF